MTVMEHRTSFALDEATILRLRRLAGIWRVSQAEVVRKAIKKADEEVDEKSAALVDRLRAYHGQGGIDADAADSYLDEVAENRADWGRER
jgi:Arc/MetJ-type ribon-helix-helix transcriptional regulator